jgi:YD repeat-containing protein
VKQLVTVLIFLGLSSLILHAGSLSMDREGEQLHGPVQNARTEAARISKKSGRWIEEKRELVKVVWYDTNGKKTEETPGQSSIVGLFEGVYYGNKKYAYDEYGRLSEIAISRPDGPLLSKQIFTYDALGRLLVSTSKDYDRSINLTTRYSYDGKGRLIKEESDVGERHYVYDAKGLLVKEESGGNSLIYSYDAKGHKISTTNYDAHGPGLGIEKVVTRYDSIGNIIAITTYYTHTLEEEKSRQVSPPNTSIYTYEYDSYGNWVKQARWICTAPLMRRKFRCEPSLVAYRTLSYY